MAVILEAYLLGCGQAMLDSFTQQVKAVEVLHKVAQTTKTLFPDRTDLPVTGETQSVVYGIGTCVIIYDLNCTVNDKHL